MVLLCIRVLQTNRANSIDKDKYVVIGIGSHGFGVQEVPSSLSCKLKNQESQFVIQPESQGLRNQDTNSVKSKFKGPRIKGLMVISPRLSPKAQ